jgi:hypothetical protein
VVRGGAARRCPGGGRSGRVGCVKSGRAANWRFSRLGRNSCTPHARANRQRSSGRQVSTSCIRGSRRKRYPRRAPWIGFGRRPREGPSRPSPRRRAGGRAAHRRSRTRHPELQEVAGMTQKRPRVCFFFASNSSSLMIPAPSAAQAARALPRSPRLSRHSGRRSGVCVRARMTPGRAGAAVAHPDRCPDCCPWRRGRRPQVGRRRPMRAQTLPTINLSVFRRHPPVQR